jgi:hypothetical protein
MRLAGTASVYSASAISQLTRIAIHSGALLCFGWPYQAKVMNTFEAASRRNGRDSLPQVCGRGGP